MSNGAFLLLAVGLSIVGSLLIWLFNRKPKTFMSSIDDFSREMKALGHENEPPASARRRRRPTQPSGRGPASLDRGARQHRDDSRSVTAFEEHPDVTPDDDRSGDPTEERRS